MHTYTHTHHQAITHTHTHTLTRTQSQHHAVANSHTYTHTHARTHAHAHADAHAHTHAHAHARSPSLVWSFSFACLHALHLTRSSCLNHLLHRHTHALARSDRHSTTDHYRPSRTTHASDAHLLLSRPALLSAICCADAPMHQSSRLSYQHARIANLSWHGPSPNRSQNTPVKDIFKFISQRVELRVEGLPVGQRFVGVAVSASASATQVVDTLGWGVLMSANICLM